MLRQSESNTVIERLKGVVLIQGYELLPKSRGQGVYTPRMGPVGVVYGGHVNATGAYTLQGREHHVRSIEAVNEVGGEPQPLLRSAHRRTVS